jgi:hypothetical protein
MNRPEPSANRVYGSGKLVSAENDDGIRAMEKARSSIGS